MKLRKFFVSLLVSLICAASSSRLMAQANEAKCEDAIAQKLKSTENIKKVSFLNNTRRSIPHGPLTHYAGKGFYAVPGGGNAEFEWFCDVTGATGKPENLYYEISKTEAPALAAKPAAAPKEKEDAMVDGTPAQECQNAV